MFYFKIIVYNEYSEIIWIFNPALRMSTLVLVFVFAHSSKILCKKNPFMNFFDIVYKIEHNEQNIDKNIYIFKENFIC